MAALYSILIVALCALAYAVKGGQHRPVKIWLLRLAGAQPDEKAHLPDDAKGWHKALQTVLDGKIVSAAIFAALVLVLVKVTDIPLVLQIAGLHWVLADAFTLVLAAAFWLAAVAPSMGEETGGTGGYMGAWGEYVEARNPDGKLAFDKGYGAAKCRERGTWHGAMFALLFGTVIFIPFGALMPVSAWLGISWEQKALDVLNGTGRPNASWWRHEWIYGGICPGVPLALWFVIIPALS